MVVGRGARAAAPCRPGPPQAEFVRPESCPCPGATMAMPWGFYILYPKLARARSRFPQGDRSAVWRPYGKVRASWGGNQLITWWCIYRFIYVRHVSRSASESTLAAPKEPLIRPAATGESVGRGPPSPQGEGSNSFCAATAAPLRARAGARKVLPFPLLGERVARAARFHQRARDG